MNWADAVLGGGILLYLLAVRYAAGAAAERLGLRFHPTVKEASHGAR